MNTRPTLAALALSPLLLALAPVATDVAFKPADDSQVTRDYSIDAEFSMDDISMIVDGNDMSSMIPMDDLEGALEISERVTEHFVHSEGGRPLELIRTFEEASGHFSGGDQDESLEGLERLVGKSVRFLWNEDEGDYDVSYHECEGDPEDIDSLSADMDLRALLPRKGVEQDDTWSVDARELESVLLFGARIKADDAEVSEIFDTELRPQLERILDDFETTCTYKGVRETDGQRLGVIGVKMHGEGTVDLGGVIRSAIDNSGSEVDINLDIDVADLTVSFESEGEMLWDLDGGHLHGFDMDGKMQFALEISVQAEAEGESHSADIDAEMGGQVTWKVDPSGA